MIVYTLQTQILKEILKQVQDDKEGDYKNYAPLLQQAKTQVPHWKSLTRRVAKPGAPVVQSRA